MKNLAGLSLILLAAAAGAVAQAPPMQRGISVEMAITTGAGYLPDADKTDAWIVTVTSNGDVYFGVDSIPPEKLFDAMKSRPRNRQQELYLKVDARAPVGSVEPVLEAARSDWFRRVFLLTATPAATPPGKIVPPAGIPLWLESTSAGAVVVQINDDHGSPRLKINNEEIPLKELQHELEELLRHQTDRSGRSVVLKADRPVPFADIVHVVDACDMASTMPVLVKPEL